VDCKRGRQLYLFKKLIDFSQSFTCKKNESVVNAKSIMGIMSLAAAHDDELLLKINGPDEQEAFKHLRAYLENEK